MTEIEQAQRLIRAIDALPPNVVLALTTLIQSPARNCGCLLHCSKMAARGD